MAKKDFYYSAECELVCIRLSRSRGDKYIRASINGHTFTEQIDSGKEPTTRNYKDNKLIFTGSSKNCKYESL